jgi:hypothetical protein
MKPKTDLSWKQGGAELSDDGLYRYRLWRRWAPPNNGQPNGVFVMLNPSKANERADDPTVRRCVGFDKRLGWGGLEVVNLYAWIATHPKDFWHKGYYRVTGDERNMETIVDVCSKNGDVVLAWGAHGVHHRHRVEEVMAQLKRLQRPLYAFAGVTKNGQPPHPLRLPSALPLFRWDVTVTSTHISPIAPGAQ